MLKTTMKTTAKYIKACEERRLTTDLRMKSRGLFLESTVNVSGPESPLSDCNLLVLKTGLIFENAVNVRKTKKDWRSLMA